MRVALAGHDRAFHVGRRATMAGGRGPAGSRPARQLTGPGAGHEVKT